jgi:8-oxo-dGTP diphosphatase
MGVRGTNPWGSYNRNPAGSMSEIDVRGQSRDTAPVVLFDTQGRLLLQLRDDVPGVLFGGMIGLFGGHREGTETFLECAVRELREELSCTFPAHRYEYLCSFRGIYPELPDVKVRAELFVLRGVSADALIVAEGTLVVCNVGDIHKLQHRLTPTARLGLATVLGRPIANEE